MGGRLCREMSFSESKRVSWRRYPSHTAACLTIDRIGYVGVSAPTANRQTQAAPVLEPGITTNTSSGKGQGPLWRY